MRALTRFSVLFSLAAACSSPSTATAPDSDARADTTSGSDSLVTEPESSAAADRTYANALCSFFRRCWLPFFNQQFASYNQCVAVMSAAPDPSLLPGEPESELAELISILASDTCAEVISGAYALTTYGTRADGTSCFSNVQCQSGTCQRTDRNDSVGFLFGAWGSAELCGTCGGTGAGGSCTYDMDCRAPLACIEDSCQGRLANGDTCQRGNQCQSGFCELSADGGTAGADAANGQCAAIAFDVPAGSPETPGHACQGGWSCKSSGDAACVCEATTYIALGQSCDADGAGAGCQSGYCDSTGTCKPYLEDGAACDTTSGAQCRHECMVTVDGGTTGTCGSPAMPMCN